MGKGKTTTTKKLREQNLGEKNEGEFLDCPSQMSSVAHPLLQKQWSTSASKFKVHLSRNWSIPCFFEWKKWNFLYSQWQHSSWLPWNGKESLGLAFFVNHGFLNQTFLSVLTHQPRGWKQIFFFPPSFFWVFFVYFQSSVIQRSLQDLEGCHLRKGCWV